MIEKMLLYCTKSKPYLYKTPETMAEKMFGDYHTQLNKALLNNDCLNGTVIGECEYEVEEIYQIYGGNHPIFYENGLFDDYIDYVTDTLEENELLKNSCLSLKEIENYNPNYAIHIKKLTFFDTPKQLSDYYAIKDAGGGLLITTPLTKAPQNMMRVSISDWDYGFMDDDDIRVLMSIRPEWLCLIGNKKKTIELRKVILRGMLPNDKRRSI